MIDPQAPCGLNCFYCPVYNSTANNDEAARIQLAAEFSAQSGQVVDPSAIVCHGCHGEGKPLCFGHDCHIRACALGKGFQTCAECPGFPCEAGQYLWQTNQWAVEGINRLKSGN